MFGKKLSWRKESKQMLGFGFWKPVSLQLRKPIRSISQAFVERALGYDQIQEVAPVLFILPRELVTLQDGRIERDEMLGP